MVKKGLVSIIVPVYNTAEFLPECFESLKKQSYENLEMIFVDDGSADASAELLKNFIKEDARVTVVTQANRGLASARNVGLRQAQGEWVTFVDSDDYLDREAISRWVAFAAETGAAIVASPHVEVFENGQTRDFNNGKYPDAVLTKEEGLRRMLKEEGFNLEATGKLYQRKLWEGVEFPEGKLHEDVGTTYWPFLKAEKVAFLERGEYFYRQRAGSIVKSGFSEQKMDLVELTDKMCDEIDEKLPKLKNVTHLRRMHARFSILRMIAGEKDQKELYQQVLNYLKKHKNWVLENPEAGRRDKIAMKAALAGKFWFKTAWRIYQGMRGYRA